MAAAWRQERILCGGNRRSLRRHRRFNWYGDIMKATLTAILVVLLASVVPAQERPASIFEAASAGDMAALRQFLAAGHFITETDTIGSTLLHAAAGSGQRAMAAYLLDQGLDPNAANSDGLTPLHITALHGDSAAASLLISKGALVYARDNNQMTPLHLCALSSNFAVAEVLWRSGADVNDVTSTQWTPLRVSRLAHAPEFEAWLIQHGAKENPEEVK